MLKYKAVKTASIVLPLLFAATVSLLMISFWLVPTDRLNAIIAQQLSQSFGYQVTVDGRPSVHLMPYLSVSFGPLKIGKDGANNEPLVEIERAEGRLSVTSLWEGNPALRFLKLERAVINLVRHDDDSLNWSIANLFLNPDEGPSLSPKLRFPERLRYLEFKDSKILVEDERIEKLLEFTSVNLLVTGPPRVTDLSIVGSFIHNGELFETDISLAEPGTFMTGRESEAEITIESSLVSANFEGNLTITDKLIGDGSLEADIASPSQLADWLGLQPSGLLPKEPIRLVGDGVFDTKKMDFRPVAVRLGQSKADGRMAVNFHSGMVNISGTLAFDTLNLYSAGADVSMTDILQSLTEFSKTASEIDLRLSAETITLGATPMQNMAASLVRSKNIFNLNVASLDLADISLSGQARIDSSETLKQLNINAVLRGATLKSLAEIAAVNIPLDGEFELGVKAKADGVDIDGLGKTVSTSWEMSLNNASVYGVKLTDSLLRADQPVGSEINHPSYVTKLTDVKAKGSFPGEGVVEFAEIQLQGDGIQALLKGRSSLKTDELDLTGTLRPAGPSDAEEPTHHDGLAIGLIGPLQSPRISSFNGQSVVPSGSGQ